MTHQEVYSIYRIQGELGSLGCKELTQLSHVTHINHAISIIKCNEITSGLVYDDSILNKERILVCWLSPNEWQEGYRYGSIRFRFNAEILLKKFKYIYWVEDMEEYTPTACRLLLTNNDYSDSSILTSYDILEKKGPLWYDCNTKKFYWNGHFTLELMFEDSIEIVDCTIDFVTHHDTMCNLKIPNCREKGIGSSVIKALFLSSLAYNCVQISGYNFSSLSADFVTTGKTEILDNLSKGMPYTGNIDSSHESSDAVTFSILMNYALGFSTISKRLVVLFSSKSEFSLSLDAVIKKVISGDKKIQTWDKSFTFKEFPVFYCDDIQVGVFIGVNRRITRGKNIDKHSKPLKFNSNQELKNIIKKSSNCNMYLIGKDDSVLDINIDGLESKTPRTKSKSKVITR